MLVQQTTPLLDPLVTPRCSIVVGIEPLIPGRFESAVIAIEIAMMQLVKEIAHADFEALRDHQIFEPGMRSDRGERMELQDKITWIGCENINRNINTSLIQIECSIGCIAGPDQGPVLVFLWCQLCAILYNKGTCNSRCCQ